MGKQLLNSYPSYPFQVLFALSFHFKIFFQNSPASVDRKLRRLYCAVRGSAYINTAIRFAHSNDIGPLTRLLSSIEGVISGLSTGGSSLLRCESAEVRFHLIKVLVSHCRNNSSFKIGLNPNIQSEKDLFIVTCENTDKPQINNLTNNILISEISSVAVQ